jgi:hypothetical protein
VTAPDLGPAAGADQAPTADVFARIRRDGAARQAAANALRTRVDAVHRRSVGRPLRERMRQAGNPVD